ncbi:MAG: hypothetical protein V7606_1067, partial [Burkholderiales bacterium]
MPKIPRVATRPTPTPERATGYLTSAFTT